MTQTSEEPFREVWIAEAVRRIEADFNPTSEQREILARLSGDPRMVSVWRELRRHNVQPSSAWSPSETVPDAISVAMAETLHFAFKVAQDRRTATKLAEVQRAKAEVLADAAALRRIAAEIDKSVQQAPAYVNRLVLPQFTADAEALRRIAAWKDSLAADFRGEDDPLTITNDRGDPTERGVQSSMAAFFRDRFGSRLDGIAAIVTAVALDLSKTPSARTSRSAFSRPKSP